MTIKQRVLARIRAWIDRRLPRDVLRVSIHGSQRDDNGETQFVLFDSVTHMEQILECKMKGAPRFLHFKFEGPEQVMVVFSVEHLSI